MDGLGEKRYMGIMFVCLFVCAAVFVASLLVEYHSLVPLTSVNLTGRYVNNTYYLLKPSFQQIPSGAIISPD